MIFWVDDVTPWGEYADDSTIFILFMGLIVIP